MTFAEKLKDLRLKKDMTPKQVAEAAHIHVSSYYAYEKNSRPDKHPEYYQALADVLGCDVAYLQEDDNSKPASKSKADAKPAPEPIPEPEPEPEPAPEPVPEPAPEPIPEPTPEPASDIIEVESVDEMALEDRSPAQEGTMSLPYVEIQYAGQSVRLDALVAKAQECVGSKKSLDLYIKPEENTVYYVSDDETGSFTY